MQDEQPLSALADFWPDIIPWSPRSTGWGTINQTFFVGGAGEPHVLKLYGRDTDPAQLRYEHRILTGWGGPIYCAGVCRQGLTSREGLLEAVEENLGLENGWRPWPGVDGMEPGLVGRR